MTKSLKTLTVVACLLSAGALASCNSAGSDSPSSSTKPNAAATQKLSTSNISNSLLDFYFPATGPQFNAGVTYANFENAASDEIESRCLVSKGFRPLNFTPNPYLGDNVEFPNLAYIKIHGFIGQIIPASDSPTAGMSTSEVNAYKAASRKCGVNADKLFVPIFHSAEVLQSEWMNTVAQIDETTKVQNAITTWDACMGVKGINVTTIASFFAVLGSATQGASSSLSADQAASMRYAQIFVACFGPVEDLRDSLRLAARTQFFNTHVEQIDGLKAQTQSIISDLEKLGVAQ